MARRHQEEREEREGRRGDRDDRRDDRDRDRDEHHGIRMVHRDRYGRKVYEGERVMIPGRIVRLIDEREYVNCIVLLDERMYPSDAWTHVDVNSMQTVKTDPDYKRGRP